MATNGNRLTDMEFDEISLVNRPANQLSKVVLFKADDGKEQKPMRGKKKLDEMYGDDDKPMSKQKMMGEGMGDDEDEDGPMSKSAELPTEVYEYIEALEASNAELVSELEKMAEGDDDDEDDDEDKDILKSADPRIVEILKAAEDRAEAAEQIAKAERDYRLEREFIGKAAELDSLPVKAEEFGKVLKSVADVVQPDDFNAIMGALTAANSAVASGDLFSELGKSTAFDNDSPSSEINKAAAKIIESDPGITREQAIAKAVEANPQLYTAHVRGN